MTEIFSSSDRCSGCTACAQICPVSAINMLPDSEGFLIPFLNKDICIGCKKCEQVCPERHFKSVENNYKNVYAGFLKNDAVRLKSASGAFFPAMAFHVIERGGYISGCVLDEDLMPIHIVSNNVDDIKRMQDSKYVQSDLKDCLKEIRDLLKKGIEVLFTGTSCQVAGLLSFLDLSKVDKSQLITVDFFCHGVPSPLLWENYLDFYRNKKHKKIISFRFRTKRHGWETGSGCREFFHEIEYRRIFKGIGNDHISLVSRMWRRMFFSNLILRLNCADCYYATGDKIADITMGDFWGINEILPDFSDGKGVSVLVVHNKKSDDLIKSISGLHLQRVEYEKALFHQLNSRESSFVDFEKRKQFWEDYQQMPFHMVAKKYFDYTFIRKLKDIIKYVLFKLHIRDMK